MIRKGVSEGLNEGEESVFKERKGIGKEKGEE